MPFTSENQPKERKPRGKSKPKTIDDLFKYLKKSQRYQEKSQRYQEKLLELILNQNRHFLARYNLDQHLADMNTTFLEFIEKPDDKNYFEIKQAFIDAKKEQTRAVEQIESLYDQSMRDFVTWVEKEHGTVTGCTYETLKRDLEHKDFVNESIHQYKRGDQL